MTGPAAAGVRLDWPGLPAEVRAAVEAACGAPVTAAQTQPGGFSPGAAARIRCADGRRWFVKAVSAEVNEDSPKMHRREARVLTALDPLIAAGQSRHRGCTRSWTSRRGSRWSWPTSRAVTRRCPGRTPSWARC
jgi:hypothetical protein